MQRRTMLRQGPVPVALAALLVSLQVTTGSSAQALTAKPLIARTELPVLTSSPVTGVAESVVRVRVPLPASVGSHPAQCDWLSYLRYRDVAGPARSADAARILVAQPGILEGAGAFDSVARNTVTAAAARGRHIEFWALDRRSNCLEDHTGMEAGLAAHDFHLAVDYYSRGKVVNGTTFAGYRTNAQLGWLAKVGMAQTVRDEYDLLVAELPSQSLRKQKVLCGGHSLGGIITGFFAGADFDGDPRTLSDAGYNQCAGYFALESAIATSTAGIGGISTTGGVAEDLGYALTQAGLDSGALPRSVSLPTLINAATMNMLGIAGLAARLDPTGVSDLASYPPPSVNQDTTLRLLFSRNALTFLRGSPTVKDFRLTNDAALGGLLDDNSEPLSFLQASVGFFDGGPIVDKNFPVSNKDAANPLLKGIQPLILGYQKKAIPATPHGPLYTWRNYDQIGKPGDPVYRSKDGTPFTTAASEVSDIHELARSLSEQPLDFTEWYFPTKLATDALNRALTPTNRLVVHPEGIGANPILNIDGTEGLLTGVSAPGTTVWAPGYGHLDVLTAAAKQNDGKPEPVSTALAAFAG